MKHRFIAKRYWKDQSTAMGQSDVLAKSYDDVIDLSLGDPDLITHPLIIEKAFEDAKAGHTKYTEFRGDPELRQEISRFYKEEYDMDVADEEIFVCTSACEGMYLVLESILDDGDEVLVQAPYFTPYPQQVELARGIPVELPTYEEEDFQINIERMESLITERTKALLINSPSNPTGNCLTVETMQKIAEIAEKYDLIVIADDIYTSFSYQSPFVPFASLPGMKERTLVINGFSKGFAMTGWRLGYMCAPVGIIQACVRVHQYTVTCASSFVQEAALTALSDCAEDVEAMRKEYQRRKDYVVKALNEIDGISCNNPHGAFYIFVNIKSLGMTSMEVAEYLLDNAKIALVPGSAFGSEGEGYLRISYACSYEDLQEACARIKKAVEELKNK